MPVDNTRRQKRKGQEKNEKEQKFARKQYLAREIFFFFLPSIIAMDSRSWSLLRTLLGKKVR
jgi:hypothetical protein|tara:strand:+ start:3514 stop:3699 length:186 start_codon:yes stop_codon:yes gene_type:complete